MKVIYSNQDLESSDKSIVLAGPTPRSSDVESWRGKALELLKKYNFDGIVYVPESSKMSYYPTEGDSYEISKDFDMVNNASLILFWIPRNDIDMLGLTTNVEFGYFIDKKEIMYGRPDSSIKNEYLDFLYNKILNKKPYNNLEEMIKNTVKIFENK